MEQLANRNGRLRNEDGLGWYCLRTRRKQEHVAAAHVRILREVAVFCPKIRFRRPTRGGTIWVTEALFPGYFFARFSLRELLPLVRSAHGVSSVVRFGEWYPEVADSIIEELRVETEDRVIGESVSPLAPGDRVRLVAGALAGLEAVVTHVLPGNERVRLLLEFLGRETVAEARTEHIVPGEKVGSLVLRFAARLGAIEGGNRLGRPAANNGAC
ncbi:MAG TPA: transcription termination/antitermination NusG family protein [Chthoniobacterales bacterium]|nr:transcription termination/antitermination NusG family protein [Chthoniobacterales bacterium]